MHSMTVSMYSTARPWALDKAEANPLLKEGQMGDGKSLHSPVRTEETRKKRGAFVLMTILYITLTLSKPPEGHLSGYVLLSIVCF